MGFSRAIPGNTTAHRAADSGGGEEDDGLPQAYIDINFKADDYTADSISLSREDAVAAVDFPATPAGPANFVEGVGYSAHAEDSEAANAVIGLHPDLFALLPDGFVVILDCQVQKTDDRNLFAYMRVIQLDEMDHGARIGIESQIELPTSALPFIEDSNAPQLDFEPQPLDEPVRIAARFDVAGQLLEAAAMGWPVQTSDQDGSDYSLADTLVFFVAVGDPSEVIEPAGGTSTILRARFYDPTEFPGAELVAASLPPWAEPPVIPEGPTPIADAQFITDEYEFQGEPSTIGDLFADAGLEAALVADEGVQLIAVESSDPVLQLTFGGDLYTAIAAGFIVIADFDLAYTYDDQVGMQASWQMQWFDDPTYLMTWSGGISATTSFNVDHYDPMVSVAAMTAYDTEENYVETEYVENLITYRLRVVMKMASDMFAISQNGEPVLQVEPLAHPDRTLLTMSMNVNNPSAVPLSVTMRSLTFYEPDAYEVEEFSGLSSIAG